MAETTKSTKRTARARKTTRSTTSGRKRPSRSRKKVRAVSPEERFRMIQEAAYFMAEREGFRGDAAEYWLRAEAEVDAQLAGGM